MENASIMVYLNLVKQYNEEEEVADKVTEAPEPAEADGNDNAIDPMFWPYLAGLIDADGCISFSISERKGRKYTKEGDLRLRRNAAIEVTMADLDILETIKLMIGMGSVRLKQRAGVGKATKNIYAWYVSSRQDVSDVLDGVYPYLGNRRSAKALEVRSNIEHWKLLSLQRELKRKAKKK
jgi:intein/homing endonuclease